jgi:thiol-disulfide isomerase/thioredoxin
MASMDLTPHKVVVIVFAMPECGACEAYIPRLAARAGKHAGAFQVYPSTRPRAAAIPILVYDVASPDRDVQALADRYAVSATPTTLVLRRGPGSFKVEGGLDDAQIDHLLHIAREAHTA